MGNLAAGTSNGICRVGEASGGGRKTRSGSGNGYQEGDGEERRGQRGGERRERVVRESKARQEVKVCLPSPEHVLYIHTLTRNIQNITMSRTQKGSLRRKYQTGKTKRGNAAVEVQMK